MKYKNKIERVFENKIMKGKIQFTENKQIMKKKSSITWKIVISVNNFEYKMEGNLLSLSQVCPVEEKQ